MEQVTAPRSTLQWDLAEGFQGSLRCDVNVSVNKQGEPVGTRCEIKNLNSVKNMQVAIGKVDSITTETRILIENYSFRSVQTHRIFDVWPRSEARNSRVR